MKKNTEITTLLEVYESLMPKTVYLMRNKERYKEIVKQIDDIKQYITATEPDAEFSIAKDELIGTSLGLEVVCTLLSITEIHQFCDTIKKVDSIDITPCADGMLSIVFGFNNAYIPVPPRQ